MSRENAIRRYERALLRVWDNADEHTRNYGAEWYTNARDECTRLALDNGFTVEQVAGACAALSPRSHWADNLADTRALVEWSADMRDGRGYNVPLWGLRLHAFGPQQDKAAEILSSDDDPLVILRGPKERAFYRNIMGDADGVTVDVWATRAATRSKRDVPGAEYETIAAAYRRAARKVNTTPRDFQAAIWLEVRA